MLGLLLKTVDPWIRLKVAGMLIGASLIGWPLSALVLARDEPQYVLALSWVAITLTAGDMAYTALVAIEQELRKR